MKYLDVPLEQLLGTLIDYRGKTPPKTMSGIPLITAKVIKNGMITDGNHEYIAEHYFNEWMRRGLPRQWDVLITTEAPLGEVAILNKSDKIALAQRVILLRGDPKKISQRYLCFAFQSQIVQARLDARSSGATVAGIKQSELRQVLIPTPDIAIQRRIASILSAYDDLIENNTRRIAILEEMARRIYEEWFVHFRFPGHEQVQMVESELGFIPEGWKITTLNYLCNSIEDGDWIETKDQGGKDFRLLQISNVGLNTFVETGNYRFISTEAFKRLRCREVLPGHILIARMPKPIGRAWLVTQQEWRMVTAVDVAIVDAKQSLTSPQFVLHFLNSETTLASFAAQTSGTTRPRITRRQIEAMPVLAPPVELAHRFGLLISPMNDLIALHSKRNANLRTTRDLLLPKLISGELDVSQLPEPA
jgi:type I restriction enzyme S subunit